MKERRKRFLLYTLLMLGSGVVQLLDWHYGSEDPIWHLLFYVFFMPVFSFGFGIFTGDMRTFWLIPLTAGVLAGFVYLFMANGGISISLRELQSAAELSVPTVIAASAGMAMRKIAMFFERRL